MGIKISVLSQMIQKWGFNLAFFLKKSLKAKNDYFNSSLYMPLIKVRYPGLVEGDEVGL